MNSDRIILITGGNRGIGFEICRQLAQIEGLIVIMGSRNIQKGEKAAVKIGGNCVVKKLDITQESDIRLASEFVEREFGKLDCLINNAGISVGISGAATASMDEAEKIFATNFFGAWKMIQSFLPLLNKSPDPRIINISSGMGAWSDLSGGYAGYRLSKLSLNALSVLLSNELAGNVRINAMCPGWVNTDMGGPGANREVTEGADTAVWLATADEIPHGKFLRDRQVIDW